jgi:hypothetical protein
MNHIFEIIVVILVGLTTLGLSYYLYNKSKEVYKWTEIKGKIEDIYVDKFEFVQEARKAYRSKITYSYTYQNKDYQSRRLFYGDFIRKTWPRKTKVLVEKYKSNRNIIVYVNPSKPRESVIEKGIPAVIYYLLIVGIALLIIGVLMVLMLIKCTD